MKVFTFALLALLLTSAHAAETPVVSQNKRAFNIEELTVTSGTMVRINNDDRFVHHVKSSDNGLDLDSGVQRPGEWLEVEFAKKGVYNLRCDIHPKMKLTVTVE